MAETIISVCPECQARVKVPADAVGKRVKCKKCETTYRIEAESAPADLPPAKAKAKPAPKAAAAPIPFVRDKDEDELENDKPYGMVHDDNALPRCPFCAVEMASHDAKICTNCGYDVVSRSRLKSKAVYEHSAGQITLWLLPGIACLVGVIVLITLDVIAVVKMTQWLEGTFLQNEDKSGWLIKPGAFSVYTTLFSMLFILPMGKFAYKRLTINNKPPEVNIKRQ